MQGLENWSEDYKRKIEVKITREKSELRLQGKNWSEDYEGIRVKITRELERRLQGNQSEDYEGIGLKKTRESERRLQGNQR